MIDVRMSWETKAATMITVGKNETNALAASATLRSTNSISSMRSHTRQSSRRSSHAVRTDLQPAAVWCPLSAVISCAEFGSCANTRPIIRYNSPTVVTQNV